MLTWAPAASKSGALLLDIDRELGTITNLTLRYDPRHTPPEFALKAVSNALAVTKPYFLNHPAMAADWGQDYVIASCYNAMPLKGGIYTLVRLNLKRAAEMAGDDPERFLDEILPQIGKSWTEVIASRARYIIEEVRWFEDNFWIEEGLLEQSKFSRLRRRFRASRRRQPFLPKTRQAMGTTLKPTAWRSASPRASTKCWKITL